MKNNKNRFLALILCFILSFNILGAFEVPEAEAIAGVDDVAFMCLLAGVVASSGYVVTNNNGLSALGSSIDRYISDNFDSDSDVAKQRQAVGATGIGASIATNTIPALISVIKDFTDSFRSTSSSVSSSSFSGYSSYCVMSYDDVLSACGVHYVNSSNKIASLGSSNKCAGYIMASPSSNDIKNYGSNVKYVIYALTPNSSMKDAFIRKADNSYSMPCYYSIFYVYDDTYWGGLKVTGASGNYSPTSVTSDRVVSIGTGSLSLWDVDAENASMRAYYPTGSTSFVGDGKARTLAPNLPVTRNNVTTIYEDSISDGATDAEALDRAIEALENNSAVATAEISSILNQYLSTIIEKLDSITVALSKPITEGSSALELEESQWKVVEGQGGNPKNDDDDNNKRPKWATLAFLAPLLMVAEDIFEETGLNNDILEGIESGVSSGFDAVKSGVNSLVDFVSSILDAIRQLPRLIYNEFKEILEAMKEGIEILIQNVIEILQAVKVGIETLVNYVSDILQQLQALPQALADIIEAQFSKIEINPLVQPIVQPELNPNIEVNPAIEVNPNIELQPLLNPLAEIVRLLQEILDAIKEFFRIDTASIADNWNTKTPNFSIQKYANPFIIAYDFGNEPPIIEVDTPSIVRGFYDKDKIVIFDARDFDKYFKVIRMIVNAIIIIAYAYACLCKFKVRFSM